MNYLSVCLGYHSRVESLKINRGYHELVVGIWDTDELHARQIRANRDLYECPGLRVDSIDKGGYNLWRSKKVGIHRDGISDHWTTGNLRLRLPRP